MKNNIDDRLSAGATLLYGLQWWIVTIPAVITMGLVLGKVHFGADEAAQSFYMQKLFFVLGVTLFVQVLFGHKLPLVVGPASVLLIGILASLTSSFSAIYTSIMIGGAILALIAALGLLKYLQKIFTTRVVIVIMLLIPLTLSPTIVNLVFSGNTPVLFNLLFAILMNIALLLANKLLKGVWKSSTLIIGIILSSIIYKLIFGSAVPATDIAVSANTSAALFITPEFDAGVILAFLFCTLGLMINEVGSIEAVGQVLSAGGMEKRTKRGVVITGLSNILAGGLGVVGAIDYSSSPGIIASTRCASRFPFVPAAVLLVICAFIPPLIRLLLSIPDVIMGSILVYVMISQFAAGFQMMVRNRAAIDFGDGATMGLPLLAALVISFMPAPMAASVPSLLRPMVCNGFVMGVIMVLILEHLVYRKKEG